MKWVTESYFARPAIFAAAAILMISFAAVTAYVEDKERSQLTASFKTDVAAVTTPATPSTKSTDPIIWNNGGSVAGGIALPSQNDAVYPFVSQVADDFLFTEDMDVIDVHWWGGFWNGPPNEVDPSPFWVYFYADDGTGNAPTGAGMADPAPTALASYYFPGVSGLPLDANGFYEYDVDLSPGFSAAAGVKYWIAIQADFPYPPQWGWTVTSGVQLHQAMQGFPFMGTPFWTDPFPPTGVDMAFYLTGGMTADFSGEPTTGLVPLQVQFTDLSGGGPTSWFWDFGDDSTSTDQHPTHTYNDAGYYDVELVVSNATETDSITKQDYIHVLPIIADFSGDPQYGAVPLEVQFTDLSEGDPTSWLWDFGDDSTSTDQHPLHTYNDTGYFDVKLVLSNSQGSDSLIKYSYIHVVPYSVCSEDPNDHGECDTTYLEPHQYTGLGPLPDFVTVKIKITHDVPDATKDSLEGMVIPLCYTSTSSAGYCSLSAYWNNTNVFPFPNLDRSIFRHFYPDTNRMMTMAEDFSMRDWDAKLLTLDGTSTFWFSVVAIGAADQNWWEGSRVLLATITFRISDTTTICIDSCFWPPTGRLDFSNADGTVFHPKFTSICFKADTAGGPGPEGVDVTAGVDQTGPTMSEVELTFYIENTGFETDTYDLDVIDPAGWVTSPLHRQMTLSSGESDSLKLEAFIPNVPLETTARIRLDAVSQTNPAAGDSDSLTVTCDDYTIGITEVADVPNDQGRQVRLKWLSFTDTDPSVGHFTLFRKIDSLLTSVLPGWTSFQAFEVLDGPVYPPGEWEVVATIPAYGETLYATVVPTLKDSTIAEGIYYSVFFVRAGTDDPYVYYDSPIDSGYSLDNLSPSPPTGLLASHEPAVTRLTWGRTPALDFDYYTLYRDTLSEFTPDPGNRLGYVIDTTFVDSTAELGRTYYYLASVTDFSGNESEPSNEAAGVRYIRGDVTSDGGVNVGDVVYLVRYLYSDGTAPNPLEAGDVNCDGTVDVGDVVFLVNYLYRGGDPPAC